MRKCHQCSSSLAEGAKFCQECGTKVKQPVLICTNCGFENNSDAKFCTSCGFDFSEKNNINELFEEAPSQALEEDIREQFMQHLEHKIKEEQNASDLSKYLARFQTSDFKYSFEIKIKQLAEDILKDQQSPDYQADKTRKKIQKTFHDLSDFFIIHYCFDLNAVELSEKILLHRDANLDETNLQNLILDYLHFAREEEVTYYTDFIEMPIDRLRKAGKSFLFPAKDEKIYLICDQSVLGSLKEGFAFTENALYWRMHFEPPRKVLYANLQEIKREKDWISINGHFFNAGKSLNIKVLKLLKKLKQL